MKEASNEPIGDSTPAVTLTVGQQKALIREVVNEALGQNGHGRVGAGRPSEASRPYLTVKEAAEMARLAPSAIRLFIRKRELKAHKVGSRVIIKRTDLEGFLEAYPMGLLHG